MRFYTQSVTSEYDYDNENKELDMKFKKDEEDGSISIWLGANMQMYIVLDLKSARDLVDKLYATINS